MTVSTSRVSVPYSSLLAVFALVLGGGVLAGFCSSVEVGVPNATGISTGIVSVSGAGPSGTGGGLVCSACHDVPGLYTPDVTIDGPTTVIVGTSASYSLLVEDSSGSDPVQGGFNVAIADGTLSSDDSGVQLLGGLGDGELTHDGARAYDGNSVSWDFEWEAPEEVGTYTMYAATVAGSGSFGNMEDNVATTTLTIEVVVPVFLRGDVDGDGAVSAMMDALYLLEWGYLEGPAPLCEDAADIDDDGVASPVADAIALLSWEFQGAEPPADPGPDTCDVDPVGASGSDDDGMSCLESVCP